MKVKLLLTISLLLVFTFGCQNKEVEIKYKSPRIFCTDIEYYSNENPNIMNYCTLEPANAVLILDGKLTTDVGEHTVGYTISDGEHNNFTVGTLSYKVIKYIPPCPENATYNEETEKCECNSGYVSIHNVCELKVTCGAGYQYNASTNTCDLIPKSNTGTSTNNGGNTGNTNTGGNSNKSHGTKDFMFTDGYNIDSAYNACVLQGSQYGSYSCTPLRDSEGFYIGYRLQW